eukprot:evm.model.scf_288.3 EVM.evm.TU.scf_288.3   scf_288:25718-48518(-)
MSIPCAAGPCALEFAIDADASLLSAAGALSPDPGAGESDAGDSISDPIVLAPEPPRLTIGASGGLSLAFEAPGDAGCPLTGPAVVNALVNTASGSANVSLAHARPLAVYPAVLPFTGPVRLAGARWGLAGWAVVTDSDSSLNLSSGAVLAGRLAAEPEGGAAWAGEGFEPPEGGGAELGGGGEGDLRITLQVSNETDMESTLQLTLENITLSGRASLNGSNGSPQDLEIQFAGDIHAQGVVGCPEPCGLHGKCAKKEGVGLKCDCECGWTGTTCDRPAGFCPRFVDELEGECGERFLFDPTTRQCSLCKSGWKGPECSQCFNDEVCQGLLGTDRATCRDDLDYLERSTSKVYSCELKRPLDTLFAPVVALGCVKGMDTESNFQLPEGTNRSDLPESFCQMVATLNGDQRVHCLVAPCTFSLSSLSIQCGGGECVCDGGCVEGVSGALAQGTTNADLECEEDGACVLKLGGLPFPISAACSAAECYDPLAEITISGIGNGESDGGWNSDLFVASIPISVALAAALALSLPAFAFHQRLCHLPTDHQATSSMNVDVGTMHKFGLSFSNLFCAVPVGNREHAGGGSGRGEQYRNGAAVETGGVEPMEAPKGYKSVLKGLDGAFTYRELVAIMGPSGAGKTTLLSALSGMSVRGQSVQMLDGHVLVNGRRRGPWVSSVMAFVPQDDLLMQSLTARECLTYSAVLRASRETEMKKINQRVLATISELGLERVANSQVGGGRKRLSISGGERRRVTIGMELVTKPRIVLMDEPTSGLDSSTALSLVTSLKAVSCHGRLVVLSIHQPSQTIFSLFDRVMFLARGFQIYLGPPSGVSAFLSERHLPTPPDTSAAEHMIESISDDTILSKLLEWVRADQKREEAQRTGGESAEGGTSGDEPSMAAEEVWVSRRRSSSLSVLFWRGFVDICRNPSLLLAHLCTSVFIGLGLGAVYYDLNLEFSGAQSRFGGFFFVLAFMSFTAATIVDTVHAEQLVVMREVKAGYYSLSSYVLTRSLLDAVLLRALPAVILCTPMYFMMGLQTGASRFLIFIFTAVSFNMVVGILAMAVTMLSSQPATASLVINTLLLVALVFGNFLVKIGSIPAWLQWLNHLSIIGYALRIMAVNEVEGVTYTIDSGTAGDIEVEGAFILQQLGIDSGHFSRDIALLSALSGASLLLLLAAAQVRLRKDGVGGWAAWARGTPRRAARRVSRRVRRGLARTMGHRSKSLTHADFADLM